MASGDDPLSRLEARLDAASEAAERLIAEAAEATVRRPPPAGWQRVSGDGDERSGPALAGEVEPLLEAVHALRDRIPPDLQRRLGEALRDLLLALRALIDWYLERAAHQRREPADREPAEAEDIPIS